MEDSTVQGSTVQGRSIFRLFRTLTSDTRTLIRQEIKLARTELSENVSKMGRSAVAVAVGGFIAYAGLIVLLTGLGWLAAWLLAGAGLQPVLAAFVGEAGIGLLVTLIGAVLLLKSIKTLSREPLAPHRTLHTLQELKHGPSAAEPASGFPPSRPSSAELETRVEATENHLGSTLEEIGHRLSPQHINAEIKQRIQAKPYSASLVAAIAGVVSGLLLRRRFRHG